MNAYKCLVADHQHVCSQWPKVTTKIVQFDVDMERPNKDLFALNNVQLKEDAIANFKNQDKDFL